MLRSMSAPDNDRLHHYTRRITAEVDLTPFDSIVISLLLFFFFQAEDGIRDLTVTGVQTCALPICLFTPSATILTESMSSPESVSSRTAIFGWRMASWSISQRFFSPPENPSFR